MIQKRLCSLITKVDEDFYVMVKVRVMVMQNVNVLLYRKIPLIRPGRIYGQIGLHIRWAYFRGAASIRGRIDGILRYMKLYSKTP